jgi:site-specific recombinase XerD
MTERTMNRLLMRYLERLPGAMHETDLLDGSTVRQCIHSPHSLRATSAPLLLDSGVPIEAIQDLLDYKHITTTQFTTSGGSASGTPLHTRCRFSAMSTPGQ